MSTLSGLFKSNYVCFIDLQKVFDKVQYDKLLENLLRTWRRMNSSIREYTNSGVEERDLPTLNMTAWREKKIRYTSLIKLLNHTSHKSKLATLVWIPVLINYHRQLPLSQLNVNVFISPPRSKLCRTPTD